MDSFWNILSIAGSIVFVVFFFGACIFIHELGHFLAAKWRGLHIDAFSIGFRAIWHKKVGPVDYRIGWLPFGGYCELPQIDSSADVIKDAAGNILPPVKPLDRLITALAGPSFNILFGLFIGCFIWYIGIPSDIRVNGFEVVKLAENSPEHRAGLRNGDWIEKLNGQSIDATFGDFANNILTTTGKVDLAVRRGPDRLDISYIPAPNPDAPGELKHEKIAWPFFSARQALTVTPNGAAERAGLRDGDLIVSLDGQALDTAGDIEDCLLSISEAKPTAVTVRRNGETLNFTVIPDPVAASADLYAIGITFNSDLPVVKAVNPFMPARDTIRIGDRIDAVNGTALSSSKEITQYIRNNRDKKLDMTVTRDGRQIAVSVTPQRVLAADFGFQLITTAHPSPWSIFTKTCASSYRGLKSILLSAARSVGLTSVNTSIEFRHMSGPLSISTTLYSVFHNQSFMRGLYFVAFISFALAIFNLLPLPVLDGGFILFALIELVFRRPLPRRFIRGASMVFMVLLIALMCAVTLVDGRRVGLQLGLISDSPAAGETTR